MFAPARLRRAWPTSFVRHQCQHGFRSGRGFDGHCFRHRHGIRVRVWYRLRLRHSARWRRCGGRGCVRGNRIQAGTEGCTGARASAPASRSGLCLCLGPGAQPLAGRQARPGTGIDFAHDIEQLLGFFLRVEIPHVQTKALARLFAPARNKKRKALQPRVIRRRERDRRRGRAQIDDEQVGALPAAPAESLGAEAFGFWAVACCMRCPLSINRNRGVRKTCSEADIRHDTARCAVLPACGNPAIPSRVRDRWLCVPVLRQVCS